MAEHPDKFQVVALSAGSNVELLAKQVKQFRPSLVSVKDAAQLPALKAALGSDLGYTPTLVAGAEGIVEVARHPDAHAVVTGIVGCAGLQPTVAAIKAGKDICLANKETLIAGGPFVLPLAAQHGVQILPADSEHSAIFQCIQGLPEGGMRRVILTASGGAFRDWPVEKLKEVKVIIVIIVTRSRSRHAHCLRPTPLSRSDRAAASWPPMTPRRRKRKPRDETTHQMTNPGGGRAEAPQLVDGPQDHGGLGHADEQGAGGD